MRKIVCGLIISVCLGVNLYADNSKRIPLYFDMYENGDKAFLGMCGIEIKPMKDSYSFVEYITWIASDDKGGWQEPKESDIKVGSCATFNGLIKKNNARFIERKYYDAVEKTLYVYANGK